MLQYAAGAWWAAVSLSVVQEYQSSPGPRGGQSSYESPRKEFSLRAPEAFQAHVAARDRPLDGMDRSRDNRHIRAEDGRCPPLEAVAMTIVGIGLDLAQSVSPDPRFHRSRQQAASRPSCLWAYLISGYAWR